MPTKLSLDYSIIMGPFGNTGIKNKINGKPEKLPFESMYLKESPKEVLSVLGKNYQVHKYLNLKTNEVSIFEFKKHSLRYGLSVREENLQGVTINNSLHKEVDLSFLPKLTLTKDDLERKVQDLVCKYLVTTYIEHGPITGGLRFNGDDGRGPRFSSEKTITENYFKDRKKSKNPEKEKQLSQILEYAQIILDKPEFSIRDLEEFGQDKSIVV